MKRVLFLLSVVICFFGPAGYSANPVCRTAPGYQFRYTKQDKNNPANNILWLEDNKGFRIVEMRGADCKKVDVVGNAVYWMEYPGHVINGYDIKTRFYESYSEGGQFLLSPDGQKMVVERTGALSLVKLQNKNETTFYPLPEKVLEPGSDAAVFLGWSSDGSHFWFAEAGPKNKPLDFRVLTRQGELVSTNMRADAMLESVFYLNLGWVTQNNGTELAVFDLIAEKKWVVDVCEFGDKFKPRWTSAGHLKYFKEGKEKTVLMTDIKSRLAASSSSASTINKREFVPVSW